MKIEVEDIRKEIRSVFEEAFAGAHHEDERFLVKLVCAEILYRIHVLEKKESGDKPDPWTSKFSDAHGGI